METDRRERIALEKKLQLLTEENNHLKKKVEELEDRTDSLDDQRRQINLRFSGIQEAEGENWEQSQQKLGRILQEKLNINPSFERVYRVGRPSAQRSRDIIARFSKIAERDAVFRDRRKMKGSNIYINEDFFHVLLKYGRSKWIVTMMRGDRGKLSISITRL